MKRKDIDEQRIVQAEEHKSYLLYLDRFLYVGCSFYTPGKICYFTTKKCQKILFIKKNLIIINKIIFVNKNLN